MLGAEGVLVGQVLSGEVSPAVLIIIRQAIFIVRAKGPGVSGCESS